jgi:hypothetical protein
MAPKTCVAKTATRDILRSTLLLGVFKRLRGKKKKAAREGGFPDEVGLMIKPKVRDVRLAQVQPNPYLAERASLVPACQLLRK